MHVLSVLSGAMEKDGEQNQQGVSTNGSMASGTNSRPSMNSMSLYERQAVQVGVFVKKHEILTFYNNAFNCNNYILYS